jgi:prepilin signal peptidase PulO-like enzyme (type II secretory pathway)
VSEATLSLLGTVLSLIFALAGYFLIPVLKRWLDAKVGTEKSTLLLTWAATFVKAVEQTQGPGMGGTKYALVLDALRGLSNSQNIKVDEKTLEAAIESAVLELQQKDKPSAVGNVVVTPSDSPVIVSKEN